MSGERAIIEVEKLSKAYGLLPALRDVSFRVEARRMRPLARREWQRQIHAAADAGRLEQAEPADESASAAGRYRRKPGRCARRVGLVAHQPLLYENLSARENLHFFGKLYAIDREERERRSAETLRRVDLHKRADSLVRTLLARDEATAQPGAGAAASTGFATAG